MSLLKKISLWVIYLGVALCLATPLLVDNSFFFPFITTKAFFFRIVVEATLLAFLLLAAVDENYRPRFNLLTVVITLFIAVAALSSWLGHNFYFSFWGDMERSEGLILWLHLWFFMVMLTSVARSEGAWCSLFDVSLVVSLLVALFGLGQALQWKVLLATSGARVDATFGNASFLAAYLLFQIAFACYLFLQRSKIFPRLYYGALIVLFAWVIFATQTRGAVVGLVAAVLLVSFLSVWGYRHNRFVRNSSLAAILLIVILGSFLYLNRNQVWVKNSAVLHRIVSISLQERTAETRLATWQAAWSGWKERFWLGYGLENFEVVFNKNFPPIIYEDEGSQVWFDRAHNLIFDRAVTTGVVGLALYLVFLFLPAYWFWRRFKSQPEKRASSAVFLGLILAFFVQDLFVFETITTYVILFFTWSFFGVFLLPEIRENILKVPKLGWWVAVIVYAVLLGPLVWEVNILPAKVNRVVAATMNIDSRQESFYAVVDRYKDLLNSGTYGQEEYRVQFVEFIDQQLANVGAVVEEVKPILAYTDQQVTKQIEENPTDAKNYLLAMRHYNYTFASLPEAKFARLDKALSFFPKLQELTPTRPHIYQEAGYSHLYYARQYQEAGDKKMAQEHFDQAEKFFQKTVDLDPQVVESYINLIMLYFNAGESEKIGVVVNKMNDLDIGYRQENYLKRLKSLALANKSYHWLSYFSQGMTELFPQDENAWIDLALSYAYEGDREKAIETAEHIKSFNDTFAEEADKFIANVKTGYFEKNRP